MRHDDGSGKREKNLELDVDGYLQNLDSWNVSVADQLAQREGIEELTGEHWKLIAAIRLHYERTGMSPLCRDVIREAGFTKDDTYRLFPTSGTGALTSWRVCRSPALLTIPEGQAGERLLTTGPATGGRFRP